MFNLYALQARFGDCFLLEYGENDPAYILIDGGPARNYEQSLKTALTELLKDGHTLESVIISHVDNDHIMGVLDLLVDLKFQKDTGATPFIDIHELWFNSFSKTLNANDFENRIHSISTVAGANGIKMQEMNMAVAGIKEGYQVVSVARFLNIQVNPGAENGVYMGRPVKQCFQKENLRITVVGPTAANLQKLQDEWEAWITKNEEQIAAGKYTKDFAAMSDRSVPNLSSIVLLIEADQKTVLLTGDCRGDHLQQGLTETGLSSDGKFHVDILKLPHHGSKRNSSKKFFQEVTADTYIISADGTYDNPDEDTLIWIVEAAKEAGRKIKIFCTNETDSTKDFISKYDPGTWGYSIDFIKEGSLYSIIS